MEVQEEGQAEVEKLRRFFYTGSTTCVVRLPFKIKPDTVQKLLQHINRVSEGAGRVMLPLQLCLEAERSNLIQEDMLFLALACCLKIDCKASRTQVYTHLKRILVDSQAPAERLLEFKYHHRMVFKKKPFGMGAGMKKLVKSWYHKQDAFDLAVETQRVHSRHKWSHEDLIKLAHVTAKGDPAKEAVLDACVRGFDFMQKKLEGNPKTTPIMDYMASVQKLKATKPSKANKGVWDPEEAVRLIGLHSFDMDLIPTEQLKEAAVWEAGLLRLPLDRLLTYLKSLARRDFLSNPDSGVFQVVLDKLKHKNPTALDQALKASNLTASQILIHHTKVSEAWKPLPGQPKEKLGTVHPTLVEALDNLLHRSLNIPSKVRVVGQVLVAIDCRPTLAKNNCWGQDGLSCARAAAASLLSLKAEGATLEVVTSVKKQSGPGIVEIGLGIGDEDRLGEAVSAFTSVQEPKAVDPSEVVAWARERGKGFDMILVISDSCTVVKEGVKEELIKYRKEVGKVKFVYSVLGSKSMDPGLSHVAVEEDGVPKMLDIMGWAVNYVPILQAFLADHH